jgi:hypothetical protein
MNGLDRVAHFVGQLRYFQAGVSGVATTIVKKVTDVVRLEDFNQAFAPEGVWRSAAMAVADSFPVSIKSSVSAPIMPLRPA